MTEVWGGVVADTVAEVSPIWRKQDWAYSNVRKWILNGALPPAGTLDQDEIARKLNVSRLPLRQALDRLLAEGLVEHQPHQRWTVSAVSVENARDVYAGREALEVLLTSCAARLATSTDLEEVDAIRLKYSAALDDNDREQWRAHDRAFHNRIFQIANMPRTLEAHQQLRTSSDRYIAMYMSDSDRLRASDRDHMEIATALRAGDVDHAGELAKRHVRRGLENVEQMFNPS